MKTYNYHIFFRVGNIWIPIEETFSTRDYAAQYVNVIRTGRTIYNKDLTYFVKVEV